MNLSETITLIKKKESETITLLKMKELENIKEKLQQHFKNGLLTIGYDDFGRGIELKYYDYDNDKHTDYCTVLLLYNDGTYNNEYMQNCKKTNININDLFEEIGENLKEVKVKPKVIN